MTKNLLSQNNFLLFSFTGLILMHTVSLDAKRFNVQLNKKKTVTVYLINEEDLNVDSDGALRLVVNTNLSLKDTTSATIGNIVKGGQRFISNYGTENIFVGIRSGNFTTNSKGNSGFGTFALRRISTGSLNTAVGRFTLQNNTLGNQNTAVGSQALANNVVGNNNTASGANALAINKIGNDNTAIGTSALISNNEGDGNTAVGTDALRRNTGSENIGLGKDAGSRLLTGDLNIYIGNSGPDNGTEDATLRIGQTENITQCFIAGIANNTMTGGLPVVIDSQGQLGVTNITRSLIHTIEHMGNEINQHTLEIAFLKQIICELQEIIKNK